MYEMKYFVIHLYMCSFGMTLMAVDIPGYFKWSLKERDKVFCPETCKTDESPDRCCSCKAKPCWEINSTICPIGKLSVEYIDIFGNSNLIGAENTSAIVELIHTHGFLIQMPNNTCDFDKQMVTLDLRFNRLGEVEQIRCLTKLDTLRLDNNFIQFIDNATFTKMTNLRVLTMSHNLIKQLPPNVLIVKGGNVPIIDFSENHHMDLLDISNVFRPGPFCKLNFTGSYVEHITNELDFVMEKVMHGPGDLLLERTHFGSFFNFTSMGIDFKDFTKYIDGMIRIDESSIDCDCSLYPVLNSVGRDIGKYWPNLETVDGQTFECYNPEYMKGKDLISMVKLMDFDDLKCDITETPECPHYFCHCIDMPSQGKVMVNCTGVGLTTMPEEMPIGAWNNYKIDLILADNKITILPERNYYSRLVNLDLRQNNISVFSSEAAGDIVSRLNIHEQLLTSLPSILQHQNPNMITFGPHPVVCDCSNTWIGDWIRLKHGHGRLNCSVNGEIIPAEEVSDISLNCDKFTHWPTATIISSSIGAITLFVVITGLCFTFRYELMILKRNLTRCVLLGTAESIDVFVSYYEENESIFRMVNQYIKPALVEVGYTVFVPWQDIKCGDLRDESLAKAIDCSVNYVIVLCNKYADDYQTVSELEMIWNSFRVNKGKQIILINFDNLESNEINDDRLRAVKRTRCLDFRERESNLIHRLRGKIGKPLQRKNGIEQNLMQDNDSKQEREQIAEIELEMFGPDCENLSDVCKAKPSVFNRLSQPKSSECNCKYRRCYLHGDIRFQQPASGKHTSGKQKSGQHELGQHTLGQHTSGQHTLGQHTSGQKISSKVERKKVVPL